jgi:hypothetical protein
MAQLPTYTAKVGDAPIAGGRRAEAGDFGADLSPVAKVATNIAARMQTDVEENESRAAVVANAEIRAKYAKALDEAAISGAPVEPLKEQMRNEFGKLAEGFKTRKGVDAAALYSANNDMMMDEQINAINVRRASAQAKEQGGKLLGSLGQVLFTSPSQLPKAEQDVDEFVATFASRLSPEQRAAIAGDLKKSLNVTAAQAAARLDPKGTMARIDAGDWNMSPEQRLDIRNYADREIRMKEADDARAREQARRDRTEASDVAYDKYFKEIVTGKANRRAILDDPQLEPRTREHLIVVMESRAKELQGREQKSDPRVMRDLMLRVLAPDGDATKIYNTAPVYEALKNGKLNTRDALMLNGLVAGQKDENGRTLAQRMGNVIGIVGNAVRLDPKLIAQPEVVAQIQLDYQARIMEKVEQRRKANEDPNDLFNPASKDYVGNPLFYGQSIETGRALLRSAAQNQIPKVNSKAEFDALPPGATYIDSKGNTAVKSGGVGPGSPRAVTGVIQR